MKSIQERKISFEVVRGNKENPESHQMPRFISTQIKDKITKIPNAVIVQLSFGSLIFSKGNECYHSFINLKMISESLPFKLRFIRS